MSLAYHQALQTIINEFKNINPEITNTVIFKKNGETIAINEGTTKEQTQKLLTAFNTLTAQAQILGNIEAVTIQGANSQLNISAMKSVYMANVSSKAANEKVVRALTRVLVPTVVKLVDEVAPELSENMQSLQTLQQDKQEKVASSVAQTEVKKVSYKPTPKPPSVLSSQSVLAHSPGNQFMVEKIGGLLVSADTVRVDSEIVAKWSRFNEDKEITQVSIQTLEGKTTTCKLKPIKEGKSNAKGIIQIPEKILQTLQTGKGKLVIVKPVIN